MGYYRGVNQARILGIVLCSLGLGCSASPSSSSERGEQADKRNDKAEAPAKDEAPETVSSAVDRAITDVYGESGWGMANQSADALVDFVSIHRRDGHLVYITHGVAQTTPAHEFVLRIRHEAANGSEQELVKVAPMWPVQLLVEIAETEKRIGKPFPFGDSLGGIEVDGVELAYRNVVFLKDSVLRLSTRGRDTVVFVQTVLFDDTDYAQMDAIKPGETNTVLKTRMEADPLGLVDG